jgi:hypothetical protein
MSWRLLHLIPVMSASGPDVTRGAFGRLAGEIALLPTAFRCAAWAAGADADEVTATWHFPTGPETARLRVSAAGELTEVIVDRWAVAVDARGQTGRTTSIRWGRWWVRWCTDGRMGWSTCGSRAGAGPGASLEPVWHGGGADSGEPGRSLR